VRSFEYGQGKSAVRRLKWNRGEWRGLCLGLEEKKAGVTIIKVDRGVYSDAGRRRKYGGEGPEEYSGLGKGVTKRGIWGEKGRETRDVVDYQKRERRENCPGEGQKEKKEH